jgi:transposase, IS30 family
MNYTQLSEEERHRIGALRSERKSLAEIARSLGRAPSTVSREVRRNRYPTDGHYRARHAHSMANGRRKRSRLGSRIGGEVRRRAEQLLRIDWSPEQISGHGSLTGGIRVSHETIYKWVWQDKADGGTLWMHLRGSRKKRRKRYGAYDSRGRLAGKRMIDERPPEVETRECTGHWEVDTVHGAGKDSVVTLVERKSGYVEIGKIEAVTVAETSRSLVGLIARNWHGYQSITADNGAEFHGYRLLEEVTGIPFYFAHPHHSWERGTNENTNGLIRQYLPKGRDLGSLTQEECDSIATKLNTRPRKRHNYQTPEEVFFEQPISALHS